MFNFVCDARDGSILIMRNFNLLKTWFQIILIYFLIIEWNYGKDMDEWNDGLIDVFESGDGEYDTYRIPSIVRCLDGTLIAFCEGRVTGGGDSGNIDLVARRSGDSGRTWSPNISIWNDGPNTCGNPAPVVDQTTGRVWLLMTWNLGDDHESQIMKGTSQDVRHVYVSWSDDCGQSWAAPKRISENVRLPHWRWYATGPGNGIQLSRGVHAGRMIIPANHSDHSNPGQHPYRSHIIYSDDHGATWRIGGIQEDRTNESSVAERANGDILQSMRSYHNLGLRAEAVSSDGGILWSRVKLNPDLITPVCQASLISWMDGGATDIFLFSSPSGRSRSRFTLYLSQDGGRTWPLQKLIYPGSAAYSNLVQISSTQGLVLFERDDYKKISLSGFRMSDEDWLPAKQN